MQDRGPTRQHPSPLDSSQTLPLPRKRKPRCTKNCACHDFSTCLSKVLRVPRKMGAHSRARATTPQPFRQLPNAAPATQTQAQVHEVLRLPRLQPKCCACHSRWGPTAARATTSQPFRQLPNAAPATQTQAQVHEVLCLPRFQHLPLQSAASATQDGGPQPRARQHPSPLDSSQMLPLPRKRKPRCTKYCACHDFATCLSKALRLPREMWAHSRARDNTPALQTAPKCCPCHANASPGTRSTAPATTSALASPKCCACHSRWGPTAARATTSQPFRQLPNAAPATQTQAQVHEVLRLPRFQHLPLQSAAPATRDGGPQPRARQHPSPLNSSQMLPLPRKRKPCVSECV